jgi:hypothetical protein
MRRGHPGFVLVVAFTVVGAFWLAFVGAKTRPQTAVPPAAIPEALRAHLRSERFAPVTTVAALPAGLRDALNGLFNTKTLDVADPGAPFQATDVMVTPRLPPRRLTAAGCSADHCLVYYERGGFAHVHYAVVFKVSANATRFEFGGLAAGGLRDLDAVKDALVSGKVVAQSATTYW